MRAVRLTLLALVAMSVCMTVVWFGHAVQTGCVLPEPDAPPARATYLAEQTEINGWLMLGAGLSWLVTLGAAIGLGVRRVVDRRRIQTERIAHETRSEPDRLSTNQRTDPA